jgi:hypothetical protein
MFVYLSLKSFRLKGSQIIDVYMNNFNYRSLVFAQTQMNYNEMKMNAPDCVQIMFLQMLQKEDPKYMHHSVLCVQNNLQPDVDETGTMQ